MRVGPGVKRRIKVWGAEFGVGGSTGPGAGLGAGGGRWGLGDEVCVGRSYRPWGRGQGSGAGMVMWVVLGTQEEEPRAWGRDLGRRGGATDPGRGPGDGVLEGLSTEEEGLRVWGRGLWKGCVATGLGDVTWGGARGLQGRVGWGFSVGHGAKGLGVRAWDRRDGDWGPRVGFKWVGAIGLEDRLGTQAELRTQGQGLE